VALVLYSVPRQNRTTGTMSWTVCSRNNGVNLTKLLNGKFVVAGAEFDETDQM
jgi:hypothetical protein